MAKRTIQQYLIEKKQPPTYNHDVSYLIALNDYKEYLGLSINFIYHKLNCNYDYLVNIFNGKIPLDDKNSKELEKVFGKQIYKFYSLQKVQSKIFLSKKNKKTKEKKLKKYILTYNGKDIYYKDVLEVHNYMAKRFLSYGEKFQNKQQKLEQWFLYLINLAKKEIKKVKSKKILEIINN